MGLYRLDADVAGELERRPTIALEHFRRKALVDERRPILES
jgi:hypothetical protein